MDARMADLQMKWDSFSMQMKTSMGNISGMQAANLISSKSEGLKSLQKLINEHQNNCRVCTKPT
jgi:hypothetical protein